MKALKAGLWLRVWKSGVLVVEWPCRVVKRDGEELLCLQDTHTNTGRWCEPATLENIIARVRSVHGETVTIVVS